MRRLPDIDASARRPPISTVISGAVSVSKLRPVDQQLLGRQALRPPAIVAEAVGSRLERRRNSTSVCSCDASMRPGVNGTVTSCPASFAAFSIAGSAAENDQVGERNLLAAGLRRVELVLDRFELLQHRRQLGRLVDLPILLRG